MKIPSESLQKDRWHIEFRCAEEDDASQLLDYLKTVSEETTYLLYEEDEIQYTLEDERTFIRTHNESPRSLLLLLFVHGQYAGNASFSPAGPSRRNAHRADLGIALYQTYTGKGFGRLLMEKMLREAQALGYTQCELTVVSTNARAIRLYEKLGFRECGRIPNANRYDDGSISDDLRMVVNLCP